MGILSSMFAAVSGLNATGSSISIIGDNIANTNTIGKTIVLSAYVLPMWPNDGFATSTSAHATFAHTKVRAGTAIPACIRRLILPDTLTIPTGADDGAPSSACGLRSPR